MARNEAFQPSGSAGMRSALLVAITDAHLVIGQAADREVLAELASYRYWQEQLGRDDFSYGRRHRCEPVTPTVTEVGVVIVCVSVHVAFAPDPSQKPTTFAWATDIPAVIPPTVRRPITAHTARRRDLCIVSCLSNIAGPPGPLG